MLKSDTVNLLQSTSNATVDSGIGSEEETGATLTGRNAEPADNCPSSAATANEITASDWNMDGIMNNVDFEQIMSSRPHTVPHSSINSTSPLTHLHSDPFLFNSNVFTLSAPAAAQDSATVELKLHSNKLLIIDQQQQHISSSSYENDKNSTNIIANVIQDRELAEPSLPLPITPSKVLAERCQEDDELLSLKQERKDTLVDALFIEEVTRHEIKLVDIEHHEHSVTFKSDSEKNIIDDNDDDLLNKLNEHDDDEFSDSIPTSSSLCDDEIVAPAKVESQNDDVEEQPYNFAWSVASQKGYRYRDLTMKDSKMEIHARMEDMYFPATCHDTPNFYHEISGRPFQVFLLADGHGGYKCAEFSVSHLPREVISLVNRKEWDFKTAADQEAFRHELQEIFLAMDEYYCNEKLNEYREWIQKTIARHGAQYSGMFREDRPADDGCTLVLNILYDGFMVNANVGDSRSLLLSRDADVSDEDGIVDNTWIPEFASIDHTPAHPEKAHQIHINGGRFILNGCTASVNDIINKDGISDSGSEFLSRCRIGRQVGWIIDELNYPAFTTLNLTGTVGDLFFKYSPPLINARPDVSFVQLDLKENGYMLIMASDGLWDHMAIQEPAEQNALLAHHVQNLMEGTMFSSEPSDHTENANGDTIRDEDPAQRKLEKLSELTRTLADRELMCSFPPIYAQNFLRYDDATVFAILIEGKKQQLQQQQ